VQADQNGWGEYKRLVLKELEDLNDNYTGLNKKIDDMKEDIIILKVKSGLFGGIAGLVTALALKFMG
jgi:NADH:ubiquinone oxidoreductase subunit F (NADH-binding)